jgi:hypothetical protein
LRDENVRTAARILAGLAFFTTPLGMIATAGTLWFLLVWIGGGIIGGLAGSYLDE